MNLPPAWVDTFARAGWRAVHWSEVGDPRASDDVVFGHARDHGFVLFTHDLDFGTILARTRARGPSVIQVRAQNVTPTHLESLVMTAIRDHAEPGSAALVSESAARLLWPGSRAVGQVLVSTGRTPAAATVIGVVRDARFRSPDVEPVPGIYLPGEAQSAGTTGEFLVRTRIPAEEVLPEVRRLIRSDPRFGLGWASTAKANARGALAMRRLRAWLFGAFAVAGIVILSLATLALVAMQAATRSREMGLRIALGDTPGGVLRRLLVELLGPVGAGLIAAAGISVLAIVRLQPYLYGAADRDWRFWVLAMLVVATSAVAGAALPVLKLSRTNPVEVLRAT